MGFPEVGALYGVDVPRAQVLVFRALLDVMSGGTARVPDVREDAEVLAMVGPSPCPLPASQGEGFQVRKLWDQLTAHREAFKVRLDQSAAAFAASPDRMRDEWLRRIAIVVVLALTAFFYWREQTQAASRRPRSARSSRPSPRPDPGEKVAEAAPSRSTRLGS